MPGLGAEPGLFQPCGEAGQVGAQSAGKLRIGCAYGNPHLTAALAQAHLHALFAALELKLYLPCRRRRRGVFGRLGRSGLPQRWTRLLFSGGIAC